MTPSPLSIQGAPLGLQPTTGSTDQLMEPFYVSMRLPGERGVEFVLMLPFQIERPPSMPAWLSARCDGPHYGQLHALTFPQGVDGPSQAESFIDQNPEISGQLTLWNQQGSRVLRGNLLALPLDQSILYVKPIFLVAVQNSAVDPNQTSVPQLTRVILVNEGRAVMAPTLGEALAALVHGQSGAHEAEPLARQPGAAGASPGGVVTPPAAAAARGAPVPAGTIQALVRQANQAYNAAIQAQRRGDWSTYGTQLQQLEQTLRELERRTGGLR
jgi:uncharacterized protein